MTTKTNARYVQITSGKLEAITPLSLSIDELGRKILASDSELSRLENDYFDNIDIWNTGSKDCYISFSGEVGDIDTSDSDTYNVKLAFDIPFAHISLTGRADRVVLKCASGENTTLTILVW